MLMALTNTKLYFLIGAIAFVFLLVFIFLISLIIKRKKFFKNIENMKKEIENDQHEYFKTYFEKLRKIAENNPKYQEIYLQVVANGNKLLNDTKESLIAEQINLSKRCKIEKINKKLIENVKEFSCQIDQYKKDLDALKKSLDDIFKASEKLRSRCTDLSQKYRSIQNDIENYQGSLVTCYDALKNFCLDIGTYFDLFEDYMRKGLFEEASKKLDTISEYVYSCYGKIEMIAKYNNMLVTIIPNDIKALEEKNLKLEEDGYIVSHIQVEKFVKNALEILDTFKEKFASLNFAEFEDFTNEIQVKNREVLKKLDAEVEAKKVLDEKYKSVKDKISHVESEFIRIKRQYVVVNEYYKLSKDIVDNFENYEKKSTKLSSLNREYQNYIFANNQNPATFMLEKVNNMDTLADDVLTDITFISNQFIEIKKYVEETYEKVERLGVSIITSCGKVREKKCYKVYNKYRPAFDSLLSELKNIDTLLHEKPIDIETIHNLFGKLSNCIDENREKMLSEMNHYFIVEKSLLYANPLRFKFSKVENELEDVEKCFVDGNYEDANKKIQDVLNKFHPDAYETFSK